MLGTPCSQMVASTIGVLTQRKISVVNGNSVTLDHPITSGKLGSTDQGSICYLHVHETAFLFHSYNDHLPLKHFLEVNTLNKKVNNWAVELESFKIKFEHIKGKSIILADTLSRLINIDPDFVQDPDLENHEFRQYGFENLLDAVTVAKQINSRTNKRVRTEKCH